MNRDAIVDLTLEQMLRELARDFRQKPRCNLDDYYQLLACATAYTFAQTGCSAAERAVGFEITGIRYLLLFMTAEAANDVASRCKETSIEKLPVREVLQRVPDGWGVIVDWNTDVEVRISPTDVIEFNERFGIWRVRQEATEEWLAKIHSELVNDGISESATAAKAMEVWSELNGFRVLPGSRRARRIEHILATFKDADKAQSRDRCEEGWRTAYVAAPYLHHLTDSDLRSRLAAVMTNLLFVDRPAFPHELMQIEWMQLFQDVRYEHDRRGLSFIDAIKSIDMLQDWPNLQRGTAAFAVYEGPPGQLFRYSKRKYLEPLLRCGDLTLFPATQYSDPSLLRSQRDDELARTLILDGTQAQLEHTDRDGIRHPITAVGSIKYTMSSPTNYYVWFTTTTYDPRLFDDFEADACMIIHDAPAFTDRLRQAVEAAIPRWVGADKLVRYFDPLREPGQVLASFEKDFRFAYQREYRFVWDPPAPEIRKALSPLQLSLGPLHDICTLVLL